MLSDMKEISKRVIREDRFGEVIFLRRSYFLEEREIVVLGRG